MDGWTVGKNTSLASDGMVQQGDIIRLNGKKNSMVAICHQMGMGK